MNNNFAFSLDKLLLKYESARTLANDFENDKKELGDEIKQRLEAEKLDEAETPVFVCTYKYDKDKEIEVFDEDKFAKKDPKQYAQYQVMVEEIKTLTKKYTKKSVTKGARKLIVTRKNEEEL